LKKILFFTYALLLSSNVFSQTQAHWGYEGETGPESWATLSKDNFSCSGKNQSPINLTGFIKSQLSPITFHYASGGYEILNNGHTVQINYKKGSTITVNGNTFNLLQFHFHAPSENHINGKSYPLEAHLVHADKSGNLAVIAMMFEEGKENKELAKAWKKMPKHEGGKHKLSSMVNINNILPNHRDYYRFNGSLTTPPCSEGVRWFVEKQIITASKEQINAFKHALHGANNRPLQPLNARLIME